MNEQALLPSKSTAVKSIHEAFKMLKEENGQLAGCIQTRLFHEEKPSTERQFVNELKPWLP